MRFDIHKLDAQYHSFKVKNLENRYLPFSVLQSVIDDFHQKGEYHFEVLGYSSLGQPIYKTTFGTGEKHLLIWSQMHGNESTGTRAMFDVLSFLALDSEISNQIKKELTITFIPMLNPDGANAYTRVNALGIDMNRDLLALSSVEINLLVSELKSKPYKVLFNLHDQRNIFNVGNTNKPATLSFLAPSQEVTREVTASRKNTMGIISLINQDLQQLIPGRIGRYTDEFYPTATGDNFQKWGYLSVLFEAGFSSVEDPDRNQTRKYNALAILSGMEHFSALSRWDDHFKGYFEIPENGQIFTDVIIRDVNLKNHPNTKVDIGIQFTDEMHQEGLQKIAKITEIGDLRFKFGHTEYRAEGEFFASNDCMFPRLNQVATFTLGEKFNFVNGELL
ncbi:MAG: peptidase M14 [Flavobacteriaceae bacterium]|nr:MAG: peptidase M14 [Flavobacteriaceae bacterium]